MIALTRRFEKIESVFEICVSPEESEVKLAAWTFSDKAFAWWKDHVKALTLPVENSMAWGELKNLMLDEYCPRGEVQNLEQELWNRTVKDSDIEAYISRFNDLVLLCTGMFTSKSKKVKWFIWGLTLPIQGNVIATNPSTFDSAKRLAQKLYDHGEPKGTKTAITKPKNGGDNKKNWGNKRKGQQNQESGKKQQIVLVHAATTPATTTAALAPVNSHVGALLKSDKCSFQHNGT